MCSIRFIRFQLFEQSEQISNGLNQTTSILHPFELIIPRRSGFKYTVSADKGFVHSEAHSAFVSQKKNHFQVTVTAYGFSSPKFIKTDVSVC